MANFILALSRQPWQKISQENNALNEDTSAAESKSDFIKNLSQDTLGKKVKILIIIKIPLFLS